MNIVGKVKDNGILRLPSKMLNDADYGTLSDHLYRRYIECALLASRCEPIGCLPRLKSIAWHIHVLTDDIPQLQEDLIALWREGVIKRGIDDEGNETWYVPGLEPPSMTRRELTRYMFIRQRRERYAELVERDGEYCQHCGETHGLSVDHVLAIANGGGNDIDNLQLLCRSCNSRKGAR